MAHSKTVYHQGISNEEGQVSMTTDAVTRRLIENEVLFRRANQKIGQLIEEAFPTKASREPRLYFYCECSNEACKERIILSPKKFRKLHANQRQFLIKPGHELLKIERVVKKTKHYFIVEKHATDLTQATKLKAA